MAKLAIALIAAALATPAYAQEDARKLKTGDFVQLYQKVGCTDLSDAIISGTLADSIDRLHKEVEQEELWASAVSGYTQPVPDYEPDTTLVAHYLKPGRPARKRRRRRRAANENDWRDAKSASA